MNHIARFEIVINYTQIAIFRPEESTFFELWTDDDVARGHQWRDGHIVFGVEDHDGACNVTVSLADPGEQPVGTGLHLRIGADGVLIETIMDLERPPIRIAAGSYLVWFTAVRKETEGLDLSFVLKAA